MAVTVMPRSESGAFRDTALVYLDGRIDAGAPDRLAEALSGVDGRIAIWLNSPGGNLFAGMQLGRVIRKHGASTHIIDPRTLLPGECYSACSLAFLGGVYRFNDNGARYGVHRASLRGGPRTGDPDLDQDLSSAIRAYVREMGVDPRLLDLWLKARPDEMYVLSQQEARNLGVVNNGRKTPQWSIAKDSGGSRLEGRQVTADGTGTVSFSCDRQQTVFGSVYEGAGKGERIDPRGWSHWLTIEATEIALTAPRASDGEGSIVRSTFVLPPDVVRLVRSATQVGHRMKPPSNGSTAIGYAVDIDNKSASMVRSFLGNCLRGQAK
jgi:ATP-dependent protease ClpP protease subunit